MLLLAGCADTGGLPVEPASAAGAASVDPGVYTLAPGDKVRISVYGEPDLAGVFAVTPDGAISFPLAGNVPASGQTVGQFRDSLTARLAGRLVHDPRVTAEIDQYRPFYVLGEVNKPGQYPYVIGLTVETAVATAEGYTYRGNERQVILRRGSGAPHRYQLNGSAAVPLQPGDVLTIPERHF